MGDCPNEEGEINPLASPRRNVAKAFSPPPFLTSMRLPRRNRAGLLWRSGDPAIAPSRHSPWPGLVLGGALGAAAALYPAVLPARLLFAFLSGLFVGTALPGLARRCPKCEALLLPGPRFCGKCGSPLEKR